jgi:hypothetical protein
MRSLRTFLNVFAAQFIAWVVGDSLNGDAVAWRVMGWCAENWLWPVMIANGLLWSALITVLLLRFVLRTENRAGRAMRTWGAALSWALPSRTGG